MPTDPGTDRDETELERLDRNWEELLQELRVTQTGVQILTGFLVTLPFQARFGELTPPLRHLYLIVLVLSVTATGLIIAPVSAHRILFRHRRKDDLVAMASWSAKAGLTVLALAVSAVVGLVFELVLSAFAAWVAATLTLVLFTILWLVVPITMRRTG